MKSLPYKFGGVNDWDGWMLKNSADNIDNLSEHTYCYPGEAFDAEKQSLVDVSNDPLPTAGAERWQTVSAKPSPRGTSSWR